MIAHSVNAAARSQILLDAPQKQQVRRISSLADWHPGLFICSVIQTAYPFIASAPRALPASAMKLSSFEVAHV